MDMVWKTSPVSMTELGIYLDWQKNPQGTAYNVPLLLLLPDGTDLTRLHSALEQTLRAHPCILSRFRAEADGSITRLTPDGSPEEIPVCIRESDGEPDLEELIRPFSDPEDSLYRVQIIRGDGRSYLFADFHHILFDGLSVQVFIRELNRVYAGEAPLGENVTSADFAGMEQEKRKTDAFGLEEKWYGELLSDVEINSAPIHDKEGAEPKNSCFTIPLDIETRQLSEFVHRLGIRTSTFFTGVYGYLLSRFSGGSEALYASVHNGRTPEIAGAIGMFVKTFPVLERFSGEERIGEHLKCLNEQLGRNRTGGLFSYADICTRFNLSVPTMFAYQGELEPEIDFLDGRIVPKIIQSDAPKEELVAEVFSDSGAYRLRLSYRTDLYEQESIENFAWSYKQTVREFLYRESFNQVDITLEEQRDALDGFLAIPADASAPGSIVSLFRAQAKKRPEAVALVLGTVRKTYREIDEASDRIAYALVQRGIGRGNVVSVLIHRNEYMAVASLGVLKSGAGYQPLDPSYPPERLNFMVKDADAALVIADADLVPLLNEYPGEFLLTRDIPALPVLPEKESLPVPEEHDMFILLYTSGSTGVPKGVILEHGNLANFCRWYRKEYHLTEDTVHAAYASYGFDANMMDLYPTLTGGGCVCVVPEEIRLDLAALGQYLEENHVDIAFMTTQVGRQFAVPPFRPACLRSLSVGGEKLAPIAPPEDIDLYNLYGPTECTVFVTRKKVDREFLRIPIGGPAAGAGLYVVDEAGHRVPPCVPGELWISGPCVGRGYLNRPDLTEKAFIRNPFSDDPAYARIYRTGDIVRFLPSGEIDFIGRNDSQVKVRGFRIELTEVEGVIREFPGITDATVQAFEDEGTGEKFIAAYVVSAGEVDVPALNDFIRERKPAYMVPAVTMQIDRIPLNQNSKVNRRALPKPERKSEASLPPQNETQQKIFDCIAEVVGHREFGITTDIYEAGLSSIGAIRLNVLLSKTFEKPVSIRDLRENHTVEALERFLSGSAQQETFDLQADYPLLQTQNGILVECLAHPGATFYNIPYLFRLSERVDLARLKSAVETVIAAHPCLNATLFADEKGEYRFRRNDSLPPVVEYIEADRLPEDLVVPYDLIGGRLYRSAVYHTGEGNYLFLDFHHILCDGTSEGIILQDINSAYEGEKIVRETYTGYEAALVEQKLRETDRYARARAYYKGLLADADPDMLPEGDVRADAASSGSFEIPSGLDLARISRFCSEHGLSENAFFNAVFAFVLSKYNLREDALYTTIYNGRSDSRLDRSVTMLVRTFPVFCRLEGEKEIVAFVSEVGRQLMASMANDLYSFAEISHEFNLSSDILFIYQGASFVFDTIGGEKAESRFLTLSEAKAPLHIDVFEKEGSLFFSGDYQSSRYSEEYISRLVACLEKAAQEFTEKSTLKEVGLVNDRNLEEMDAFNATERDYPVTDIVSMFRASVERFPENTAVIFKDEVLTYREADDISERIAAFLRAGGVGRGSVVSILIHRSSPMVTASLGVLKSGAAYQPLDPSYPPERLGFMMKDAGCAVLIADEDLLERVPDYTGPVLLTKDIPALPACEKRNDHPAPEDLFILLYTSGSTGVPKGVMLEHGNIANFMRWYRDYFHLDETCRMSGYASYGFDCCMMDLYAPLTVGACVCIVEEEIRLDLVEVEAMFNRLGITHSFMTTQVARQFYTIASVPSLKYLVAAGEKLVPVAPRAEIGTKLCNGYGPTECSILATAAMVERLYDRVPIGNPLHNYKCYVVDADLRRLPPLVPGELLIAGRGVGRGYLNRPDLTEKAFIRNPFSDNPAYARAYRTGDIVRLLPDGNIDFIGRNDSQVKVRGFRIELTEVEGVIREFPGITDATVQAFEDEGTGEKFIAAYVVSAGEVDVPALNDFIRERKPAYMVPAVTMQIDRIPLNQNSKVNRRALPKPELKAHADTAGACIAAPLNVLEQELKGIVSEIVNTTEFGITDCLGDLGLSSISSIRLAMQVYKKFHVQLPARKLISEGSIQSIENAILSAFLSGEQNNPAPAGESAGEEKQAERSCRLSFAQQGVYTEVQANPDTVQYNVPFTLSFPEGISAKQLDAAVRRLVDAHSYILCRFVSNDDNEIIQEPIPGFRLEIPYRELSAVEFESYKKEFVRPFDLEKGPAVRFEIVRVDNALTLMIDMHHLVSDGASLDLFFSQLCQALDGAEPERETYTYYDFVSEEHISPEVEAFFASQLAGVEEATQLIPDVFGENLPHTERSVSVPTDIVAVKEFAQHLGVTPAAVYLGAAYLAFGRFICEDTVSIVTVSNGRSNLKLGNTMGMFVNTLPLVTTIDNREKTADFLRRTAESFSDTIAHENYPFARLAAKYDFHPSASYTYEVGVINDYRTKYGPVTVKGLSLDIAKLPVSVYIDGTEDSARILVTYDSSLYSEAMMLGLAESIGNAVRGLLAYDTLSDISLTGEAQWEVLDGYNRPWDLDFDRNDTVVTKFRRNAEIQPDKTAAVYQDKAYTYRELDELTDRLAAKLYSRACEVTGKSCLAEQVVAILLPRNENVFLLPLAAVKAGLAYEPLDPSYPKERLNFMVKDAGVCLLLADDSLTGLVDEYNGPVLTVSELYGMPEVPAVPEGPSPEDLFIMLYTSGSTGAPKGCQIEHRNLVAYAHGLRNIFCTRDDRIAAYASFGFDVNMSDVFCTLLNGGTVCLVPDEVRMNLDALAAWFDETGITALLLTTQVGVQFLQNYPSLKTLRMLVMGGEKLPAVDPSKLSYTIANGYGPTENCCGVSIFPIRFWEPNVPLGKPFDSIHAYVLDKTGHRLPAGAAGEYCLSGPQVSRGYLNRPDKTAEAYEACPFNEFRMYHTGDIVRYRQNGDIEFVGRKDGQVKIRGFRVETKEVETVIRGFAGIRDVTVQAYDHEGGGKFLAAFVVSDSAVDVAQLTEYIKTQKPAYMVPAVIMQIPKIPLTVNQKVDKKALPKPEQKKAEYVAPEGKTEEDFCAIFSSVLGIERMSAEEDFFDLGGSSILAMKVVIAAGKAGYGIVYNDVFSYPTPRAMAAFLTGSGEDAAAPAEAPVVTDPHELPEIGRDGYDYGKIHALLARNTLEAFRGGERLPLNDVLMLGGTGYLGSHVFHELITRHEGRIFCFVRPGRDESGEQRLKTVLRFYFNDDYASLFGSRIFVIEGDATDPAALLAFRAPSDGMTVINCAASVKHFARGNEIERANVESTRNLAAWCLDNHARLVHISTGSVIGSREGNLPPVNYRFDEHRLYAGQVVDNNQYIHSKFMAERLVFEEMVEHGLRAKVFRMGNLAPRAEDGAFQVNYKTNNYMNTFRAFKTLGLIPFDSMDTQVEFSPIDCLAKAVLALAETPEDCVCFMPLNPHRHLMGDVMQILNEMGHRIRGAEPEEFAEALQNALSDETKREAVGSLIAYQSNDDTQGLGLESCDNSYTVHILGRLGFFWPDTGAAYIRQFLEKLEEKGFFGGEEP